MPEPPKLPPIASAPLSVVLLAHNPGEHLTAVVSSWASFLDKRGRDYELILVDDGSTDGTAEQAAGLPERYPRLQILRHEQTRGEGAALRTALAAARHPLLFYTLCDPRYQPSDLERLLSKKPDPSKPDLEIDHVHLLSGCRAGRPVPLPLRALGLGWRILCRILFSHWPARHPGWLGWRAQLGGLAARLTFGVRYLDVACPFRLTRREMFARIPLQSDGPMAHLEILAKANFLGHVLGEEVPLAAGHHPPVGERRPGGSLRQMVAEFRRLLSNPDFGPPFLEQPKPAPDNPPPTAVERPPAQP
jgi:glycosyltransferase involved in cell wall biosynthesis